MANKIKGLLVDVTRECNVREVEFEDTLENIYALLDVTCIDVAVRKIGEHRYDLVVDDEGLLKDKAIPSVFDSEMNPQVVGNVLIVNSNEEGAFISLTDGQIADIKENYVGIGVFADGVTRRIIGGADYE